jgi:hypothetical protein
MADINLPVVGSVPRVWVYGVGIGSVAMIGFLVYRKKKGAAAAVTAAAVPADTDTADSTDTGIDPATDQPYASEYGSEYGGDPSYGGVYDPNTGGLIYPTTGTTTAPITTNAAWAQQAETYAEQVGVDPTALSAALGKFLTGGAVTADQQGLIQQAISWEGYPPVTGPAGYPPSIHVQPVTTPTPKPPVTTATQTDIPNASFYPVHTATTWANVARAENVFAGSGAALYQYNLLTGKHAANDFAKVKATGGGKIKKDPGFQIAIPVKGHKIKLPGVGTVTS